MAHIPLRLRLDGEALVSNWRWLRARGGSAACGAAVKADGYGLGARDVVRRLAEAGCRDFFVATWAEAEALMPLADGLILSILHGVGPDDVEAALASPARPVLNTVAQVRRWRESGQGRPCDVMVDTGINRLGISPAEARSGLLDGLRVQTLMSHLACADEPDHPMNQSQLALFRSLRQDVPAQRYSLANSAGICLGPDYAFGLTRPGLALYGGVPCRGGGAEEQALRPVASIEAQVVQVKEVPAGGSVGYGASWTAETDTTIAVLNLGYADGYLRQLGRFGCAWAGERPCPILGVVSMDLIVVGLASASWIDRFEVGTGGIRRSRHWQEAVDVAEGDWLRMEFDLQGFAAQSELTQYELLTMLGSRFDRSWS